ncbi:fructose-1 6-bisphosphatase chloroplastic [Phtheirospermum japonicum]|uniref:fructose-bisphosphatase n=1 Tax=Phtheirospermum japonicum TaxID=374723 RepID=A0A830DMK9_9LAMI|nr:fructose-1 6-bisphosphatase chloroplastic [Phtheirospermum japonicum]
MAEAVHTFRWNNNLRCSASLSTTRLPPHHRSQAIGRQANPTNCFRPRIRCKAVEIETSAATSAPEAKIKRKNRYDIENLTTWLLKHEQAGHIDAELTIVLSSISLACKQISSLLQRSSIINLTGTQGTINIQGEDQKKLDVISNELFCSCLRSSGRTGIIASEEEDIPVAVEETYSGNYIVVFDPIDGSANIDTSLTTGSIFGIYAPDKQCLFDLNDDSTVNFSA